MTREIKFRAWDEENKTMAYSDDGNQEYGWFTDNDGCMICENTESEKVLNNIMQYTGLKDKNGKEIYEGDIVKFELDGYQVIGEVVEICGSFGIMFDELDNDVLENNTDCDNTYCGLYIDNFLTLLEIAWNFEAGFEDTFENIEVIGNIHDNPELLMYHPAITRKITRKERERFSEQQTIFKK